MDVILLFVVLFVEGLMSVNVLLRGSEVALDVLSCIVVIKTGVVVCVRGRDVLFVTSVV